MNDINGFIIKNHILESCHLKESEITIPYGVKEIGMGALKGNTAIKKVFLPETVHAIHENAFKGCKNMLEITIPSSLTYVGDYAFHRCHSLKKIELPSTVKKLGNCVFLYCDSLTDMIMPGVLELGKQVFLNDIKLSRLHLSSELSTSCICDVFTGCSNISDITIGDYTAFHMGCIITELDRLEELHPIIKAIVIDIA